MSKILALMMCLAFNLISLELYAGCAAGTTACRTPYNSAVADSCCSAGRMCTVPGPTGSCQVAGDPRCAAFPGEYFCRVARPPNRHMDGTAIPASGENQCCMFGTETCLSANTTANRCIPVGSMVCGNRTKVVGGNTITVAIGCTPPNGNCVMRPAVAPATSPTVWACSPTPEIFCRLSAPNIAKTCPVGTECLTFTQAGTTYDTCLLPNTQLCTFDATTNPYTFGTAPRGNICCGRGSCDPRTQTCDTTGPTACCKPIARPRMCMPPAPCAQRRWTAQTLGELLP